METKLYEAVPGAYPLSVISLAESENVHPEHRDAVKGRYMVLWGQKVHEIAPLGESITGIQAIKKDYFRILVEKHSLEEWDAAIKINEFVLTVSPFVNGDPDFVKIALERWNNGALDEKVGNFIAKTFGPKKLDELIESGELKLGKFSHYMSMPCSLSTKLKILEKCGSYSAEFLKHGFKDFVLTSEPGDVGTVLLSVLIHLPELKFKNDYCNIQEFVRIIFCEVGRPLFTTKEEVHQFVDLFSPELRIQSKLVDYLNRHIITDIVNMCSKKMIPVALDEFISKGKIALDDVPEKYITPRLRLKHAPGDDPKNRAINVISQVCAEIHKK